MSCDERSLFPLSTCDFLKSLKSLKMRENLDWTIISIADSARRLPRDFGQRNRLNVQHSKESSSDLAKEI